jgi:predicted restriction endonuclease
MTTKEELELVLQIMKKHDLPMSPILEYAIQEKLDGNTSSTTLPQKSTPVEETANVVTNTSYVDTFRNLSTGVQNGKKLPHKAVLLLSILNLVDNGTIAENIIHLDKTIANSFASTWGDYLHNNKIPSVWVPFWYMKSEPFWHFKALEDENILQNLLCFAGHPSVGQMRSVIKYAYVDEKLFSLMQDRSESSKMKEALIETYLR